MHRAHLKQSNDDHFRNRIWSTSIGAVSHKCNSFLSVLFGFQLARMIPRVHSAKTLLEGMSMVNPTNDNSSRKRELEALIAATLMHCC